MDGIRGLLITFFQASPVATALTVFIFDLPRDFLSFMGLALSRRRHASHVGKESVSQLEDVTVVIPVFNDVEGVLVSVRSLTQQRSRPGRIMVISDGSTDYTNPVLASLKNRGEIDTLIINERRLGRAASGNVALQYVDTDFVAFIDCDTKLAPNALMALRNRLKERPNAGVCSGNIGVENHRSSLWTALQELEYIVAIDFGRELMDNFNAIACCSGAFSMFRRSALCAIGGYSPGSGEDLSTTLRFRRAGYETHFEAEGWAYTNAPETLRALVQQRLRWDRDAFRIQILQYRQWKKQSPLEPFGSSLQRYDYMLFTLLPTLMMPLLIGIIAGIPSEQRLGFIIGGYLFLVGVATFILTPALLAYRGRTPLFLLLLLPVYPFYQGLMLKVIRLYAYFSEAIGHASKKDTFVPSRIRQKLDRNC